MSGPKTSHYAVVSEQELQRREDERRKRHCEDLTSQLAKLNSMLVDDFRVEAERPSTETHESLIRWEASLADVLKKAEGSLRLQRQAEQRCLLLAEQIRRVNGDLSEPLNFEITKPVIATSDDLKAWEGRLMDVLQEAEAKRERDSFYLAKRAKRKLDLSHVDLKKKDRYRIDEIRAARRVDKLQKLAESIGDIQDESIRESLVLESAPLLDRENDDDFDEAVIKLNTRVRALKKSQARKADALEEAAKVKHLNSDEARAVQIAAKSVATGEDLTDIRRRVSALLEAESRDLDERYVRKAIRETLVELGYDYGEGFVQTEFGPVAYADKSPEDDYALRIQMASSGPDIYARVVARGQTTGEQDKAAEEALCEDYHAMTRGLCERGVETVLTREAKPGDYPLDRIGRDERQRIAQIRRRRKTNASRQGRYA